MQAKTQAEFAGAWISQLNSVIGFYPLTEDFEEYKKHIACLKQLIVRKAKTLDLPEGDMAAQTEDAYGEPGL